MKKIFSLFLAITVLMGVFPAIAENDAADSIAAYLAATDIGYAYDLCMQLSTDKSMHDNELGFRTAGSDAEHAAADFIAAEMEKIGLVDVKKDSVVVDKWQFNGASLKIAGTDIDIMPVSYMVNGTTPEGITAEIVDCGTGFAYDYEGKDVAGKIVLVGVDQWNEAWIGQYMAEAYEHGAAAIVSYAIDGYGRWSDDVYQIQDVCCEDLLPSVCVTKAQGDALIAAIEAGNTECTLVVDSVMEIGNGIGYNVVGRIPGKSSDQQFIVSGHYDMYFEGFQDDCSAIACIMTIAKGIIDSGIQPENDILVVAHCAEEWGISGTEFDWTRGAWEQVNNTHPEWAEKTLAMFNFELCAFDDGGDTFYVSCVPEYRTLVNDLVTDGILTAAVSGREGGISSETFDTTTMEDGISYRLAGVPYFVNVTDTCASSLRPEGEYGWTQLHYHTQSDDYTTWYETTMRNNVNTFGAMLLAIDGQPALRLDLTQSCNDLAESFIEELAALGEVDVDAWYGGIEMITAAAEAHNAKIADANARYAAAADEAEKAAIREECVALNAKTLAAFKYVQDNFIGIEFSSDVVERHVGYQDNVELISAVLAALEQGVLFDEEGTGALDLAWGINALSEYAYYIFTPEAADILAEHTDAELGNAKLWGTDKGYIYADTWPATVSLLAKAETGETDFADEIAVYEAELSEQFGYMVETINAEIEAMNGFAALLAD